MEHMPVDPATYDQYAAPIDAPRPKLSIKRAKDGLFVEFLTKSEFSASTNQYEAREQIHFIIPGVHPTDVYAWVTNEHREQYADIYNAFKAGMKTPESGIPIEEVPWMRIELVDNLRRCGIRVAEQLANADDRTLSAIGPGGRVLKERMNAWLEARNDDGATASKLTEENKYLKDEIVRLSKTVKEFASTLENMKRKKGAATNEKSE